MSAPRGNTAAPTAATPRRSGRLSNKSNSIAAESAVTNFTSGGTKQRRSTAALTKVQPRRSNAYGAAGRMGQPERVTVAATGFAQAFQNQRGSAFNGDEEIQGQQEEESSEEEEEEEEDENVVDPPERPSNFTQNMRTSANLSPKTTRRSSLPESQVTPGYSFIDSHDSSPSDDDDLAESMADTSKSFGPSHESGMLQAQGRNEARFPIQREADTPSLASAARRSVPSRGLNGFRTQANVSSQPQVPRAQAPTRAQMPPPTRTPFNAPIRNPVQAETISKPAVRSTPSQKNAIGQSVDELIAEETARLQQEGPPRSQQSQRQSEKRHPRQRDAQEVDEWLVNVQPLDHHESAWHLHWKKIATWGFSAMAVVLLLTWFMSSMISPGFAEDGLKTPGVLKSAIYRVANARDKLAEFINPYPAPFEPTYEQIAAYQRKHGEDHYLWGRMTGMEQKYSKSVDQIENKHREIYEAIEDLKKDLPDLMIVRRHEDGSTEISDEFWHALTSKARSKGDDPDWIRYLEDTRAKLDVLFDPAATKERSHTESWAQWITRNEFAMHIERQYQNITKRVDSKIEEATQAQSAQLKNLVEVEAKKAMMKNIRLSALAQANLIANYELHLTKPNYFSTGLGAIVDADMTSATLHDNTNWLAHLGRRLALIPGRNPPRAALSKWEEPGDCWCSASTSPKGQSQLAVSLSRPMKPKQITIEHIPMTMVPTRNINNAPRNMELWVQTTAPIVPYFSAREIDCRTPAPAEDWKCLGSFKYNIHASNHLQTFDLAGEPKEAVRKAMLRVTANWGADHTCLYRVRLHGEDEGADYEYPVGLMDE